MNGKQLIGTVIDTVIKIVLILVIVMFIYKYALEAYNFGYRVFAEEPVSSAETATTISISISEEATAMDIGEVLVEKGLIRDARLFWAQEVLSGHHNELRPGIYELNSAMTCKEMVEVLTAEPVEEEAGEAGAAEDEAVSGEEAAAGEQDEAVSGEEAAAGEQDEAAGAE